MLDILTLFPVSADPSEVEAFVANFVSVISKADGFRSVRTSSGDVMSRGGPPPFRKVIELSFASLGTGWHGCRRIRPPRSSRSSPR